jgi:hypothetical protein
MVKTRDLNDAVLAGACGPRALQAGTLYQRQGRVTEVVVREDGRLITARVQGNETRPYRQTIAIEEKLGRIVVSGECTCPVGFNCKHVAAAIVAARDIGGTKDSPNRATDWGQSSRRETEAPLGLKGIPVPASQPQAGLLSASLTGWTVSVRRSLRIPRTIPRRYITGSSIFLTAMRAATGTRFSSSERSRCGYAGTARSETMRGLSICGKCQPVHPNLSGRLIW